jgi:hypothetical protein
LLKLHASAFGEPVLLVLRPATRTALASHRSASFAALRWQAQGICGLNAPSLHGTATSWKKPFVFLLFGGAANPALRQKVVG